MSGLERQIQIPLDDERYERLEREASQTGRSIAAIVREAIDLRFASGQARRADAGRRLMAEFADHQAAEPDWNETKSTLEEDPGLPGITRVPPAQLP